MKTYIVSIPITGALHIEVRAESEKDAKKAAWEKLNEASEPEDIGEVEWEFTDKVTEGNVTYAMLNETEVNEIK